MIGIKNDRGWTMTFETGIESKGQPYDTAGYFYGCAFDDDYLFRNPASLPRYGHLVRKVMAHYLGDRYNPHLHGLRHEPFLRMMVQDMIAYKVLYRTNAYDWQWIDQSFRKYFSTAFELDLPFDQCRIDAGFDPAGKAARLIEWTNVH